jgi:exonuclease SbcD
MKILHFADAHIDIANFGRHDPQTGLPVRVLDFLKSLDTIVDAAIQEKVDLVIFAGDAYKDRNPAPTFQREWGRRMFRLSQAKIPTLLLVGNHDLSPALGRAHAMEEYNTLQVPYVHVLDKPVFLHPEDLHNLPVQVLALPYVSRSGLMAHLGLSGADPQSVYEQLEVRLRELVSAWLESADPNLPVILTAHASVEGAKYGGERSVMLGSDLALSPALVRDPRLDYVALGHIHKPQNLNENAHPPVIYPGSIERVDFGEASEDKFFIIAEVEHGRTQVAWRQLKDIRPFVDVALHLDEDAPTEGLNERIRQALPAAEKLNGAMVRMKLYYPARLEPLIDEQALRQQTEQAFEFRLVKQPQMDARLRLPNDKAYASLTPLELLELYWQANHLPEAESRALLDLASRVLQQTEPPERGEEPDL